jgi:hypothetical protein
MRPLSRPPYGVIAFDLNPGPVPAQIATPDGRVAPAIRSGAHAQAKATFRNAVESVRDGGTKVM